MNISINGVIYVNLYKIGKRGQEFTQIKMFNLNNLN